MAYRVAGAGALYGVWLDGGAVPNEPNDRVDLRLVDLSKSRAPESSGQGSVPLPVAAQIVIIHGFFSVRRTGIRRTYCVYALLHMRRM